MKIWGGGATNFPSVFKTHFFRILYFNTITSRMNQILEEIPERIFGISEPALKEKFFVSIPDSSNLILIGPVGKNSKLPAQKPSIDITSILAKVIILIWR